MTICIDISGLNVCVKQKQVITSGSSGIHAKFKFDNSWNDFDKVAVFIAGGERQEVPIDDSCIIPASVFSVPGYVLKAGVIGTRGTDVRPTKLGIVGLIRKGASAQ